MVAKPHSRFFFLAGWAIGLVTLLSLLSHYAWTPYLELASHFKLQYFGLSLLLAAALALARTKQGLLLAAACLALQVPDLLHWYLPAVKTGSSPALELRVLLLNVYRRNQAYESVLRLLQQTQPDLAVLLEVNPAWLEPLQRLQPTYPFLYSTAVDRNFGIVLLSRFAAIEPVPAGPSLTTQRPYLHRNFTLQGQGFTLLAVHPDPPTPALFEQRNQLFQELSRSIQARTQPLILLGDLNSTMWSPYYQKLVQETGLSDSRRGAGILPTWSPRGVSAYLPELLAPLVQIPIDHCLVSPEIQVAKTQTGSFVGSDHLPLLVDLRLPLPR